MEILSSSRYSINSHCMQGNAETMAANRLSYFFNMSGPSVTYNTACSSSLVAIHGAVQAIQSGECDWAIAGGANALLDPRYFIGRNASPSEPQASPTGAPCRPTATASPSTVVATATCAARARASSC